MNFKIEQELEKDYAEVECVVEKAFEKAEHTDHTEHELVGRLRKSNEFVSELSLVAKVEDRVVGHVLLTKMWVQEGEKRSEVLALAPVAVLPEYQSNGVGSKLIEAGLAHAKELGYKGVIVLGHEHYYPRFGFKTASGYGIKAPFEVPDEVFMALELVPGGLEGVSGIAVYSPAFMA